MDMDRRINALLVDVVWQNGVFSYPPFDDD